MAAAEHAAIVRARDLFTKHVSQSRPIFPDFFVEISDESGGFLSMPTLRRVLFGEAIADRHRGLCAFIPYPCLRLTADLTICDANRAYSRATLTDLDWIYGINVFNAFPDNPADPGADGVKTLSASLHTVLQSRQPHRMLRQRYDVRDHRQCWQTRCWRPINVPVLTHNGEVDTVIHHVEDVTAWQMKLRPPPADCETQKWADDWQ